VRLLERTLRRDVRQRRLHDVLPQRGDVLLQLLGLVVPDEV
jgi:hypothetical protein